MKKFSKISVVLLISLFCILGLSTIAFAEETQSSNGLQASIVTDSDEYKTSDDIKVDFKVKNTNGFDINSVSMNTVVPKGLTVKDNAPTNKDVGTLKSGKEESYSVILNANGTGSNTHNNTNTTNELPKSGNTTNNESTVGTGDTTNVVILAIILVIAAVVIICNRKKLSKHISVMLCFAVCLTSIPMISMSSANAAEQDSFTVNKTVKIDGKNYTVGLKISYENNTHSNNVQPSDNESVVTRGEWAEMLVTEFSMKEVSKSDTELPYNDINNSKYCSQIVTAYYHSILPTNIEEFKPDEYATRDFAAYTLNNCLGYVKNSDLKCNDFDSIKYQDEVSALTERGYFELENNKFMPEKAVTTAEMDKIKSLIAESLEGLKIDENHENVIDVNDDAVIIYDNVIKSIDGNTVTLIVNNETSKLKEGSIFFVPNPENVVQMLSYKVESISVSDGKVVVVTSTPDITEMYDEVDVQGIAKSDISEIDVQNKSKSKVVVNASRNVKSSSSVWDNIKNKFNNLFNKEVSYNNTNKLDASKLRFNGKYKIKDKKDNEIVEVELNGGLENPEIEYNVNFKTSKFRIKDDWNFYVALKNTLAFDGTAKLVSKGVGAGEYTLAKVPFEICPGVGVDLSLILTVDIKGEVTVNYKLENTVGVKIDSKNGARFVKDFGNSYPEIEANVEARLGLKSQISLVLASCDVISVNAEIGVKGHAKIKTFRHDFSPHTDLSIYIYANVGYNTNDFIKKVLDSNKKMKLKGEGTEQVIKEENSPFKSKMHIEKLTIVEECTYRYVSGIVKTKGYPLDGVKVSVYDGNNEITLGEGQRNLTSTIGTFGFLIPCKSDNTNYSDKLTFKFSKDGYADYIKEYTVKTAEDTNIGKIEMTASSGSGEDDNRKVYTAAELVNMNLNEIINIMGGNFEVGCDGGDPTRGTSPEAVYIYNYDTLPGFDFYIPDANEDNRNGQDIKANIKSGKYSNYEYIRLSDDAKLTDKISANMTYNEIAGVIGEFDCTGAAAASSSYSYSTDTVGDITRYIFPPNDSLINSGINDVKRDWLRNNNPTLSGIIVYPKSQGNGGKDDDGEDDNVDGKIENKLSLIENRSAIVTENNDLYMWGDNRAGQLGLGKGAADSVYEPKKIMSNIKSVSLGESHSAAITGNGDLYMWGDNGSGYFDDDTVAGITYKPKKIMSNIKSVSLGESHSAAITENGDLYTWGDNIYGQLGDGTTTSRKTPRKIMGNIKYVSLGYTHSAAVTENGDLYTWGGNISGQLGNCTTTSEKTPRKIMSNVKYVSLGYAHSAAITENGDLYMWGDNDRGQLGDGTQTNIYEPKKIMSNAKSVVLSASFSVSRSAAITKNGDLYMWGDNSMQQIIIDDSTIKANICKPKKIMSNVKSVSFGYAHSAVIKENSDLYMWGWNTNGQLGDDTTIVKYTPTKITIE